MSSPAPCAHVRAHRTISGALPINIAQVDYSRGEFIDAPGSDFVLCLIQQGSGEIQSRFESGRPQRQHFRSGMFVPMTMPNTKAEFFMGAPMRHLVVSLPAGTFDGWAGNSGLAASDAVACLQRSGFEDALLEQIVLAMWSETEIAGASGALLGDSLRAALTWAIFRRGKQAIAGSDGGTRLSKAQLTRVEDYLAQHMSNQIVIADLANIVDMHERAFSTAFRLATDRTPYQFLVDLRIEAAKTHLHESAMSILEIAELTGFADQAHLTTVFSRHVGISPARYRKTARI
jgi:AraC family transcriptional regulator